MSAGVWGDDQTQYFSQLGPDEILNAVEASGCRCTGRTLALNSLENRVFEVELELDEAPEHRWENFRVIKFYRPGRWSREQIADEHRFMADLVAAEVPAVAPLPLADGGTIGEMGGLWFCVYPKVGGRILDELDADRLLQVGRLLSRLHMVGKQQHAPNRVVLDSRNFVDNHLRWLRDEKKIPMDLETRFFALAREIGELVKTHVDPLPQQRIHGDCHYGNLLWGSEQTFFVDFDDMLQGPVVQDLWLLSPTSADRELILEGYTTFADFPREQLRVIELLRAMRYLHFSAWIGRRWEDPAFPKVFNNYGSHSYWQGQISDLTEQLELVAASGLR